MYTIGRDPRERGVKVCILASDARGVVRVQRFRLVVEATAILPYYGLEVLQHSGFECTRSLDTSEI